MSRRLLLPRAARVLLFSAAACTLPAEAYAHIRLDASSPARDEVVAAMPSQLRLLFSARIEARYTNVTLTAPDGSPVATGPVLFVDGSDREITLIVPAVTQPGIYTVRWRTAGADGHVLEGSYSFVLAPDSSAAVDSIPGTVENGDSAGPPRSGTVISTSAEGHAGHAEPESVGSGADSLGRGLHFAALLLLLGGITFRAYMIPRLVLPDATRAILERRTWRVIAFAALLLGASAILRLWFQSAALHGAERAWNTSLLSILLTDTGWGRAWMLQAFLFAVLGMAIAWARPARDRAAVFIAIAAAVGLSAIPALSGHAAGATGAARLVVVNDALHVAGAGAWLGTLAVLMLVAVPAIRAIGPAGDAAAADAVDAFSPLALRAGALVVASGIINTVMHLTTPTQLWTTAYGGVLLVKLLLVACVAGAGLLNWKRIRPRLRDAGGIARLRMAAGAELAFALLVITATAVLTGQPRP